MADVLNIFPNQTIGSVNGFYYFQKKNAKRRKIDFKLSFDEWLMLVTSNCFYCNGKPANAYKHSGTYYSKTCGEIIYQGIDRIDNSVGYVFDNCAPCCKTCNSMKSNMGLKDFEDHILKIVKFCNIKGG